VNPETKTRKDDEWRERQHQGSPTTKKFTMKWICGGPPVTIEFEMYVVFFSRRKERIGTTEERERMGIWHKWVI
jgi:hypothetical protein